MPKLRRRILSLLQNIKDEEELLLELRSLVLPIVKRIQGTYRVSYRKMMEDQDIEQICLIELARCIHLFNLGVSDDFLAFYKVCAERAVLGALRTQRQHNHRAMNDSVSLDCEMAGCEGISLMDVVENNIDEFNPTYHVLSLTYQEILEEILTAFSEEENAIIRMHIHGYSYKDIADKLKLGPKKVDNTIQKLRKVYRPIID
ncbi:MAG: sigma-70 family RNA polymerase sigma factor [Erysipelotrichaceae bacterium]